MFSPSVRALVEAAFTGELSSLRALVMPRSSEQRYKAYLYLREFAREKADGFRCPALLLYDLLQSDSSEVRESVGAEPRRSPGTSRRLPDVPRRLRNLPATSPKRTAPVRRRDGC